MPGLRRKKTIFGTSPRLSKPVIQKKNYKIFIKVRSKVEPIDLS